MSRDTHYCDCGEEIFGDMEECRECQRTGVRTVCEPREAPSVLARDEEIEARDNLEKESGSPVASDQTTVPGKHQLRTALENIISFVATINSRARGTPDLSVVKGIAEKGLSFPERDESSSTRGEEWTKEKDTDGQWHLVSKGRSFAEVGDEFTADCILKAFRLTASTPDAPERNTGLGEMEFHREALQELLDNALVRRGDSDDPLICYDRKTFIAKLRGVLESGVKRHVSENGPKSASATSVSSPKEILQHVCTFCGTMCHGPSSCVSAAAGQDKMFKVQPSREWLEHHQNDEGPEVIGPAAGQEEGEKWGCVYNDIEGHWQIISPGGLVIIDDIGEFRYPDTATERAGHQLLAEQIRDNHNASILRLAHASKTSVRQEEGEWTLRQQKESTSDYQRHFAIMLGATEIARFYYTVSPVNTEDNTRIKVEGIIEAHNASLREKEEAKQKPERCPYRYCGSTRLKIVYSCDDCGRGWTDETLADRLSAESEPSEQKATQAPQMALEALQSMVTLWDENNPDDACACVGASEDCLHPPLCELCVARKCLSENGLRPDAASGASSSTSLSAPESSSAGGENPSGK